MADYKIDGRDAALQELRSWLIENIPVSANRDICYVSRKDKNAVLTQKIAQFKQKARIRVLWRQDLSDRLRIAEQDLIAATNTIIEMIEQELVRGGTVRINNFGDFKTIKGKNFRRVRFVPAKSWTDGINDPVFKDNLGLKQKLAKNKLKRRDTSMHLAQQDQ